MKRRRKNRVLVPFDDWSFLKAPYGYTVQMRRADQAREPQRRPSRRERRLTNILASLAYLLLIAGGVLGGLRGPGALGIFIGLAVAFGVLLLLLLLVLVVYGLLHLRGAIFHAGDDARGDPSAH